MKKDDSIDNFASLQMLGILSCRALNACYADPVWAKVTSFWYLCSHSTFLEENNSVHFYCQTKKHIHIRACYCSFRYRLGCRAGVITSTEQKPAASSFTLNWLVYHVVQRMRAALHRPEGQVIHAAQHSPGSQLLRLRSQDD